MVPDEVCYCTQLVKLRRLLELGDEVTSHRVVEDLGNDIAAVYSVPTAIYCFLRAQQPIADINVRSQKSITVTLFLI